MRSGQAQASLSGQTWTAETSPDSPSGKMGRSVPSSRLRAVDGKVSTRTASSAEFEVGLGLPSTGSPDELKEVSSRAAATGCLPFPCNISFDKYY